jgi:hypothetical protein
MKRRKFVLLTITGAAAMVVPFAACHRYSDSQVKTLGQPDLLGHMLDDKTLRAIGAAYCARTPDEAKPDKLIPILLASSGAKDKSTTTADDSRLLQQLGKAVQDDFAAGRIIILKGWVLSLTEARQCALYSFSQK